SMNNIGLVYEHRGEYDKALDYYNKALALREEIGDKIWVASTLNNIGNSYAGLGNFNKALENQLKAFRIRKEVGDKNGVAFSYHDIGLIFLNQEKYDLAADYLYKGLHLAQEIGVKNLEMGFYNLLTRLSEAQGKYKEAFTYHKEFHDLKQAIFSEASAARIAALEAKVETEARERKEEVTRLKTEELEKMVAERTAKLEAEIAERIRAERIQSVLFNISQSVSKANTLKELLRTIHHELFTLMEASNFYVALYHVDTDTYTFPYEVDSEEAGENYTSQQLKKSLTDYVRRTGKSLFVDEKVHERLIKDGEVEMVGTPSPYWIGAPLKIGRQVIGVAVLQSYSKDILYTPRDLDLLSFIADSIALSVNRKRSEEELRNQLSLIEKQQESILELSTPAIKISEGVMVVPLIGVLDSRRAQHLTEELLAAISSTQSKIVIIDITGIPTVDSAVAHHLIKTIDSLRLLGAESIITGIRPGVAQTIIQLGIDITGLQTRANLAEGVRLAFGKMESSETPGSDM
ncbi:tetratricopeptide repeat protein, partial [candidate division WOR-3 bacterium]|nr:tetratricopeptide repeat protein [candidate division WOR-3 bacterium]MBD3364575.1 tetratricopeptide repeat protein [candidate division WOR-3 bacterium]